MECEEVGGRKEIGEILVPWGGSSFNFGPSFVNLPLMVGSSWLFLKSVFTWF